MFGKWYTDFSVRLGSNLSITQKWQILRYRGVDIRDFHTIWALTIVPDFLPIKPNAILPAESPPQWGVEVPNTYNNDKWYVRWFPMCVQVTSIWHSDPKRSESGHSFHERYRGISMD